VKGALWDLLISGFNSSSSEYNASSYGIVLPSYPDESLCTDFQEHCSGPLSDLWMSGTLAGKEATRLQRLLNRTCAQYPASGETSSTVGQLKLSDATISYISERASASTNSFSTTLNLTSPTRNISSSAGGDALSQLKEWGSCPHGYVIPDDPDHTHNKWMAGTQCALACRYYLYLR
jgi:subtilisin family serine protease